MVNMMQPASLSSTTSGAMGGNGNQQDEVAKNKMKQQRILLLRHASKCPYGEVSEGGNGQPCPTTPNCSSMKKLWKHMTSCKELLNKCGYAHCNSSKYVMNHYRRCSDSSCACCEPVRDIIRKQQAKKQANVQLMQQPNLHPPPMIQAPMAPTPPSFNFDLVEMPDPTPLNDINPSSAQTRQQPQSLSMQSTPMQLPSSLNRPSNIMSSYPNTSSNPSQIPSSSQPSSNQQQLYQHHQQHYQQPNQQQRPQRTIMQQSPPRPAPITSNSAVADADAKKRKFDSISSTIAIPLSLPAELNALVSKYTISQLGSYLANLKSKMPSQHDQDQIQNKCQPLLNAVISNHINSWVFMAPVDPVALQLPDYFNVVKHPMDLGTVQQKLQSRQYKSMEEFGADVRLTFDNAMLYNPEGSEVHTWAREMKNIFLKEYSFTLSNL